ncbi:DALR anticodon-binding domain-containing protein 3 [Halocaridina rubra]|uniref:DALR anticodon-binding domain-containing protein 3 n=1 Tax=Halocaridina rubra TaxID=373956 RepID=A0AAN8ZTM7_HALRR
MRKFVKSLLTEDGTKPWDSSEVEFLYKTTIRGDSNHYCKADVVIPLKSAKVADIASKVSASLLYLCMKNPSETSFEVIKNIFENESIPLENMWREKSLLCFSLMRIKMIQEAVTSALQAGRHYGRQSILSSENVILIHDTSADAKTEAHIYRGHVILNHLVNCLKFAGASVHFENYSKISASEHSSELLESKTGVKEVESSATSSFKRTHMDDTVPLYFLSQSQNVDTNNLHIWQVLKYTHLVNTSTGKAWKVLAHDYFKIVLSELRSAMELKYGDINKEGNDVLEEQARHCVLLHLLSKNYSDNLRVQTGEDSQNSKDWAFVLYNYARLRMIFKSFEEQVADNALAPLPTIEDVDFSLLKYNEEWVLVWQYIIRWPEIVQEFALTFTENVANMKTSVMIKFMHSLSHHISTYYSRFHVLPSEPLSHLMPLMHARLYLLKAVILVMDVCFDLLGITSPPESM